jgi:hypothetical protein
MHECFRLFQKGNLNYIPAQGQHTPFSKLAGVIGARGGTRHPYCSSRYFRLPTATEVQALTVLSGEILHGIQKPLNR